jgi:hypothetical protein
MSVKNKLLHILRLKETATNFFKATDMKNSIKKAADIY